MARPEELDALLEIPEDEIATWSKKDQEWYAATTTRLLSLRSPADFAVTHSKGEWKPYRHAVLMSDEIVNMVEHDSCDLLIIEVTVRHGKTLLCSRWAPAWYTAKYRKPVGLASYEADFASTHGRWVRETIKEVGPQYGIQIDDTSRAANRWDVIGGGGMWTAGAGGPITGKGFGFGVVDDPIKNNEEANSAVYREKLWEWWQSTWISRREPGGKLVLVMSRWHQDDITGRILKQADQLGMRVRTVHLPAIAEEDDMLGRRPGEALCPERYDEEALAGIRRDVGPGPWASLYQQRPVARGGGMLRPREHLKEYTKENIGGEVFYQQDNTLVDDAECARFSTMDVAYTRSKRSDYTVMGTFAVAPADPPALMVLDINRKRTTHAEHADLVEATWRDWKPSWIGIEKQMATLSMFDEAQRNGVVVRWLKPDKHKVARAETLAALLDAGRIWVPRDAPWLDEFIDELAAFPVGQHDDQVDVVAYAAIEMTKRHVHPHKSRRKEMSADERIWAQVQKMKKPSRVHPTLGRWP